jgi:hypothetical protein
MDPAKPSNIVLKSDAFELTNQPVLSDGEVVTLSSSGFTARSPASSGFLRCGLWFAVGRDFDPWRDAHRRSRDSRRIRRIVAHHLLSTTCAQAVCSPLCAHRLTKGLRSRYPQTYAYMQMCARAHGQCSGGLMSETEETEITELRRRMAVRMPPDLVRDLDKWCEAQSPPVTRTATVETAIRAWLASRDIAQSTARG